MPSSTPIQTFRTCRAALRTRWEQHLRAMPPSSALATPEALVHLMDWTLQRIEAELCAPHGNRNPHRDPVCPCGLNPLTTYFITAENAAVETLFADTTGWVALPPPEREDVLRRLRIAIQRVALREIEAFCAMCKQRESHEHPPAGEAVHAPLTDAPVVGGINDASIERPASPHPAPRRSGWLP